MSTKPELMTRQARAYQLARCGDRLARFVELKAPEIVIENERRLILRCIGDFPVNGEAQQDAQRIHQCIEAEEQKFLEAHGYLETMFTPEKIAEMKRPPDESTS